MGKVLCERCKREVANAEVVLTQADVEAGKTVESIIEKRKSVPTEAVKTQADVEEERKPVEETPAEEAPAKEAPKAKPKARKKKTGGK